MTSNRLTGSTLRNSIGAVRGGGFAHSRRKLLLVIAHHDSALVRQLLHQLVDHELVVIEIPQSQWDFRNRNCSDLLLPWVDHPALKSVLLIGHSSGLPSQPFCGSGPSDQMTVASRTAENRCSWMQRSGELQLGLRRAKQHFVEQFHDLRDSLHELRGAGRRGIELSGLFYIAGSGVFAKYSPATGETEPLIESATDSGLFG